VIFNKYRESRVNEIKSEISNKNNNSVRKKGAKQWPHLFLAAGGKNNYRTNNFQTKETRIELPTQQLP